MLYDMYIYIWVLYMLLSGLLSLMYVISLYVRLSPFGNALLVKDISSGVMPDLTADCMNTD